MQRVLLPLIVAVAFASGPSGFAQGVAKNGDWLLRRLKTLADEAALFDAARVENVLSLKATNIQRETIPQPAACSSPADLRSIAGTLRSPALRLAGGEQGSGARAPLSSHEMHIDHVGRMVAIQIRDVPEKLHRQLKSRAALAGVSLSDYLLREIHQIAERQTMEECRARLHSHPAVTVSPSPAEVIRARRGRL